MKNFLLFIFLLPLTSLAQFSDDFSDGDFTASPVWTGETAKYEVNGSFHLHLNAPSASDTAYLSTTNSVVFSDTIKWEFYFNMNFDPSNSNNLKIYLVSDQENLRGDLNGYFIRFGENGSTDRLKFFKQVGTTGTELFAGTVNTFGLNPAEGRIRVVRDPEGNWSFYSDSTSGTNYALEGTVNDVSFLSTSFFGVSCKYTSSNNTNFLFDDFNITGSTFVDNVLPEITAVSITSQNSLDVIFSETVSQTTAETIANYVADNGLVTQSATRDLTNANIVHLTFASQFTVGTLYTLSVSAVEDLAGNAMIASQHPFVYYFPQRYDVVFNEVMADPSPYVGIPEFEYTELYNRTNVPINLKNWKFTYGTTTKLLPDAVILPDSFLVLTTDDAFIYLQGYGNVVEVEGLSTTALTNDGQVLILQDSSGNIIHTLIYSIDWYGDADKEEGGWSLEQIDPENICGEAGNWKASTNIAGGTLGKRNSVNASNPDTESPIAERVTVIDSVTIIVYFNERLDSLSSIALNNYSIDNGIGNPISASVAWPAMNSVTLGLAQPLQHQVIYNLTVGTIQDCSGNAITSSITVRFAIPEFPDSNDIIVNEILFYPYDDGVDFVEVYNRSQKVIDLKSLRVANFDTVGLPPINQKIIAPLGYLIFPSEYIVLTTSPDAVKSDYFTSNENGFVRVASMPSFNLDAGSVVINDTLGNIIDMLIYDEGMHIPLLNSFKGVSLERIGFDRSSADRSNWHSAAETAGFATPAYQNSQFDVPQITDSPVTLEPEIFSPDNDGYNDVVNFNYVFDSPGYIASITVYDSRGRVIKNLLQNELLGTSGTLSWNGINDSNEKARIGVYVAYIELFNSSGDQKNYKKSFVLGGKL